MTPEVDSLSVAHTVQGEHVVPAEADSPSVAHTVQEEDVVLGSLFLLFCQTRLILSHRLQICGLPARNSP